MKKTLTLLTLLFTIHVSAQRVIVDNVPEEVLKGFNAKYATVSNVSWAVNEDKYEAEFKMSKVNYIATFSRVGAWIMTGQYIKSLELPKKVKKSISKEFGPMSGYNYEEIEKVETEKAITYKMIIKKGSLDYKMVVSDKGEIIHKEEWKHED